MLIEICKIGVTRESLASTFCHFDFLALDVEMSFFGKSSPTDFSGGRVCIGEREVKEIREWVLWIIGTVNGVSWPTTPHQQPYQTWWYTACQQNCISLRNRRDIVWMTVAGVKEFVTNIEILKYNHIYSTLSPHSSTLSPHSSTLSPHFSTLSL